jgi:cobalamin synthase
MASVGVSRPGQMVTVTCTLNYLYSRGGRILESGFSRPTHLLKQEIKDHLSVVVIKCYSIGILLVLCLFFVFWVFVLFCFVLFFFLLSSLRNRKIGGLHCQDSEYSVLWLSVRWPDKDQRKS